MDSSNAIPFETLHFLGRMNVHLTHELQNVMATISETSGLLDDLVDLFAAGADVDRNRLGKLTGRVVQEIERGHKLVGFINSFAHSVDESEVRTDLARLVRFMVDVAPCLPYARAIDLTVEEGNSLEAVVKPYFWEHLLYGCITFAIKGLEPEDRIGLKLGSANGSAGLLFSGLSIGTDALPFPDDSTRAAAEALDAAVSIDKDAGKLTVSIPISS